MKRTTTLLTLAVFLGGLFAFELASSRDGKSGDAGPVSRQGSPFEHAHAKICSNRTLTGTFGFSFSGTAVVNGFEGKPGAVVGVLNFDGEGSVTGSVTANANGIVRRKNAAGTYAVNPDCTGSITIDAFPVSLLTFTADGVIVNERKEILFIGTHPQLVFSGVAKKL